METEKFPDSLNPEKLGDFIDKLRLAGYKIGINQHVATQELLLALIARGIALDDKTQLANYFAPILCSSAKEQQDFYVRFNKWAEQNKQQSDKPSTNGEGPAPPGVYTLKTMLLMVGIAVTALILILLFFNFVIIGSGGTTATPTVALTPTITSTPVITPPLSPNTSESNWILLTVLVAIGLLLVVASWYWLKRQKFPLFLERQASTIQTKVKSISLPDADDPIFGATSFFSTAQAFRRYTEKESQALDIDRTIEKSLQRGDWLTPVFKRRKIAPEYLFLVDRKTYQDQQAKFCETVIQYLFENKILGALFYFDGDPRRCFPANGLGYAWTLPKLLGKYSNHQLLIFSDGFQFFNPITGEIEPWAEYLQYWMDRALLTPIPAYRWSNREKALREYIAILPASTDGLTQFVQQGQRNVYTDPEQQKPYPSVLETRPVIWLQHHAPGTDQVEQMMKRLRNYLGDAGFIWLRACAVYPVLNWGLTLYLGKMLSEKQFLDQSHLAELLRLPWFRYGYIPDWLRDRLLRELTSEQDHSIRSAFTDLLEKADGNKKSETPLEIVPEKPKKNVSDADPHQDYVFLTFMPSRQYFQLALRVPEALRDRVIDVMQNEEKLRRWFLAPLAIVIMMMAVLIYPFVLINLPSSLSTEIASPTIPVVVPSTVSLTIEATSAITGCTNLIVDGSFEGDGTWVFGEDPLPGRYVASQHHSGARSVVLGSPPELGRPDENSGSSVRQLLTLPNNITVAQLRWWQLLQTQEAPEITSTVSITATDGHDVILLSPDLKTLAILQRVRRNDGGWVEQAVDMTPFRGQSFYIYFNVINDGDGIRTWSYLDDISLAACFSPTPAIISTPVVINPTPFSSTLSKLKKGVDKPEKER